MSRKKLIRSHKILLQEKDARIREAMEVARARQDEFNATISLIKEELGVPKEELDQWKFSEDGQAIEKIKKQKPKKGKDDKEE